MSSSSTSSSNSSSSFGSTSCSSSSKLADKDIDDEGDDDDEDEEDSSGFRFAGADNCGLMGAPPGGNLLRIRCRRRASISAAPLNLGTNISIGAEGAFSGASDVIMVLGAGTFESEKTSLMVISMSDFRDISALRGEADAGILGVTSLSAPGDEAILIGRGCETDRLIDALEEVGGG